MKKYNIFLDDIRIPSDCRSYITDYLKYIHNHFHIARNYQDFCNMIDDVILGGDEFGIISFDLADEHYEATYEPGFDTEIDYTKFKEKTGYHAAQYLVEKCKQYNIPLPECYVHSANTVGVENIANALKDLNRYNDMKNILNDAPDDRIAVHGETIDVFYNDGDTITFKMKPSRKTITLTKEEADSIYEVLKRLSTRKKHVDIEKLEKITGREDLVIGTWKCKRSPIGICAYDSEQDPCLDDCVFCGNPDERK